MRHLCVAMVGLLAIFQPCPIFAQMLNDPTNRTSPTQAPQAVRATGLTDASDGRLPPREVELPSSTFQAPAAGSPATVPFSVANPFSGGGREQDMGIYRVITK